MALKTFKPYTKSTRGTVVIDKSKLWKGAPYKPLTKGQNCTWGRNNNGRITSRHIGGGSKHKYRIIDFYRKKKNVQGTVERIEYDPNRTAYIALIDYIDKEKSTCMNYLPLGSKVTVSKVENGWCAINVPKIYNFKFGYVPSNHLVDINYKNEDWVSVAEQLVGTPYRWGGRDSIGLDCSALLQLSYETYGEIIPRNTVDQLNVNKNKTSDNLNKKQIPNSKSSSILKFLV